ncbi:hypothetical protein V2G26_018272 [Clonostachys chloroleuca]
MRVANSTHQVSHLASINLQTSSLVKTVLCLRKYSFLHSSGPVSTANRRFPATRRTALNHAPRCHENGERPK